MLGNKNGKQSLKGRKNLEKTKKEIASKPNQLIAIKVFEYWVDNLDSSTQESFCSFVSDNNSVIETYLYSRFLGYEGSVASCDAWIKANYKKPDHRKKLLYEIDEMQEDIRKLREDIENGVVRRDAGVGRIAQMQKELRSTISEIENFTNMRDRKGLLMAGADRAIRELMFVFKDDPIETPLEEATMSVWARMQLEE